MSLLHKAFYLLCLMIYCINSKKFYKILEDFFIRHPFQNATADNLLHCASTCFMNLDCKTFSYHNNGFRCHFYTIYAHDATNLGWHEEGWITFSRYETDCNTMKKTVQLITDGVYTIQVSGMRPQKVYCDMTTDGGGWTVFQRRKDGTVDFYRTWRKYKEGFGSASGEYWLGNSALHGLTKHGSCELRIDMVNWHGTRGYAKYENFKIGNETDKFRLKIRKYTGTAGKDSLAYHNNMQFTTKDSDNDLYRNNCATLKRESWWFNNCDECGLNGDYKIRNSGKGIEWNGFPNGNYMKSTKMMLRCK